MRDVWTIRLGALLSGGLLGLYCYDRAAFWLLAVAGMVFLRLWWWRPADFFGRILKPEIVLLLLTFVAGGIWGAVSMANLPEPLDIRRISAEGELLDWTVTEDRAEGLIRLERVVTVANGTASNEEMSEQEIEQAVLGKKYRLLVYRKEEGELPSGWSSARPGDKLAFQASLAQPKEPGTDGAFDYRIYNGARGLNGTVVANGEAQILTVGQAPLPWQIRSYVAERIAHWEPAEAGVLEGVLFGDDTRIPEQMEEQYRVTGVLHVFAASGSNAAFVMLLAWGALFFMPKRWRVGGTIGALLFYAALCGGSAPIVRATIMGVAVLLGRLWQERTSALRWLMFAGFFLFLQQPFILRDTGFQLSFSAAWGMIVLTPHLGQVGWIKRIPRLLRLPLVATLAAQLATLPLMVSAFHRLSLIGLAANVFVLGILGGVLELGLVGTLVLPLPAAADAFFQAAWWLIRAAEAMLGALAALPWADVWAIQPGPGIWAFWYAALATVALGEGRVHFRLEVYYRKLRPQGLPAVRLPSLRKVGLLLLLLIFLGAGSWPGQDPLEVVMLDVGQGDAALIRTPENHALLIDAGPLTDRYDAGERVIIPYLLENGIKELDALLITHEDADHIGGVQSVLQNISVRWIGVPDVGERLENKEWQQGLPPEYRAGADLKLLRQGDRIDWDSGVWLEVIGPAEVLAGTRSDSNNNSLALILHYQGQSVMFTGDMEAEEMESIRAGGQELDADFFKEPHHGSRFSLSTDWLDQLNPQAVLISVGKNSFGHPDPAVLGYWEQRGVKVYRTDRDGTVTLKMDRDGTDIVTGR